MYINSLKQGYRVLNIIPLLLNTCKQISNVASQGEVFLIYFSIMWI